MQNSSSSKSQPGDTASQPPRLLERLGLHRPELRAWAMYDWANSAMVTVIITAIYPLFFRAMVAADLDGGVEQAKAVATSRHGIATFIAIVIAAVLAPILGAVADYTGGKKRLLGMFMGVGVAAVACMFFIHHGQWLFAATLFVIANIAATGSFVFYDALLPHVAREDEMDRVSTAGFALGYVGGGVLLAVLLLVILFPGAFGLPHGENLTPRESTLPTRLAFVAVAVWWLVFSIPLFLKVREPARKLEADERPGLNPLKVAFARLAETFGALREFRNALLLLVAFLLYSDGISAIIRMAADYADHLRIPQGTIIGAILMTQFIGIPFTFLFGMLAGRIGAKACVFLGIFVYMGVSVLGFLMSTATHFMLLAALVGMVQGGTQALSRSLFASMIPRYKSGELFGFFGVIDKFAGALGVGLIVILTGLTGQPRWGILGIILLFIIGAVLLKMVNVEEGRRIARETEARAATVNGRE
jgi:MFS transporter, UMF1 family